MCHPPRYIRRHIHASSTQIHSLPYPCVIHPDTFATISMSPYMCQVPANMHTHTPFSEQTYTQTHTLAYIHYLSSLLITIHIHNNEKKKDITKIRMGMRKSYAHICQEHANIAHMCIGMKTSTQQCTHARTHAHARTHTHARTHARTHALIRSLNDLMLSILQHMQMR